MNAFLNNFQKFCTGFDGNVRDITKSVYNDPDDPNPKRLTMASYPLTSYDKRQLKAAVSIQHIMT